MTIHQSVERCRLAAIIAGDRMLDADAAARQAEFGRILVRNALAREDYHAAHAQLKALRRLAGSCREDAYEARDAANDCEKHAAAVADARGVVAAAVATGQWTKQAAYAAAQAQKRAEEAGRAHAHASIDWTVAKRRVEEAK